MSFTEEANVAPRWTKRELSVLENCHAQGFGWKRAVQRLSAIGSKRSPRAIRTMMERLCAMGLDAGRMQREEFMRQDQAFCARMKALGFRPSPPNKVANNSVPKSFAPALRSFGSGWQIETGGDR